MGVPSSLVFVMHALVKNALAFLAALALVAAVRAQGGPPAAFHTETLVIRGRFVDVEGKPIRRCTVRLTGHQSTGYDLAWAAGD